MKRIEIETPSSMVYVLDHAECSFRVYVRCYGNCCKHPERPEDELCPGPGRDGCPLVSGETVVRISAG